MLDISGLSAAAATFSVVAASPGPATLGLASVSMTAGRKVGLRFAMGLSFGLAFWGLIAATGLGALLQASSHALTAFKLFGGAYLLWLACKSARSAAQRSATTARHAGARRGFRYGLLLNMSNPKAVVAWMATLTLGLGAGSTASQVVVSTALCAALGFSIYALYALAFSTRNAMGIHARVRRWIDSVVAGLFAIAGFGLIRSAVLR